MAKITIVGDSFTVTSALALKDIKKIQKYRPELLSLYDKDQNELYQMRHEADTSSFKPFGVVFPSEDSEGFATVTLPIPLGTQDKKRYVSDNYAYALINLNLLEDMLKEDLVELDEQINKVEASITIA